MLPEAISFIHFSELYEGLTLCQAVKITSQRKRGPTFLALGVSWESQSNEQTIHRHVLRAGTGAIGRPRKNGERKKSLNSDVGRTGQEACWRSESSELFSPPPESAGAWLRTGREPWTMGAFTAHRRWPRLTSTRHCDLVSRTGITRLSVLLWKGLLQGSTETATVVSDSTPQPSGIRAESSVVFTEKEALRTDKRGFPTWMWDRRAAANSQRARIFVKYKKSHESQFLQIELASLELLP